MARVGKWTEQLTANGYLRIEEYTPEKHPFCGGKHDGLVYFFPPTVSATGNTTVSGLSSKAFPQAETGGVSGLSSKAFPQAETGGVSGSGNVINKRELTQGINQRELTQGMKGTKTAAKLRFVVPECEIPFSLKTPEFEEAWMQWRKHLLDKGSKPTASCIQKQMSKCDKLGPTQAVEAINYSIERNWQSIFQPSNGGNSAGNYQRPQSGAERRAGPPLGYDPGEVAARRTAERLAERAAKEAAREAAAKSVAGQVSPAGDGSPGAEKRPSARTPEEREKQRELWKRLRETLEHPAAAPPVGE